MLILDDNYHAKKNNWGKFQTEVLLIHSAELDVTTKGIITAQLHWDIVWLEKCCWHDMYSRYSL